jgi:hypothetical protein
LRTLSTYNYVDNPIGTTTIFYEADYLHANSTTTFALSQETEDINDLATALHTTNYVRTTSYTIESTDRLIIKIYARSTSITPVTLHLVYDGAVHSSNLHTTFDAPAYIRVDGNTAFTGNESMGGHNLNNLADPSISTDAATKAYVDNHGGSNYNASYWTGSNYNSTYDLKPSSTFNATYDTKPSSTYNVTYDGKPSTAYVDSGGAYTNKGYAINVQALTSSPADNGVTYFGLSPAAPAASSAASSKVYIRAAGTIVRAELYSYSGTAGTAESWGMAVRKNNAANWRIGANLTLNTNERIWSNTSINIPVVSGDYIQIQSIQPNWTTNPLTTIYGGYIYVE